ncbi:hypothetical protein [Nocardiopsis deserti]|uniref:hypothetical protein n=1 Tax=Nocardiopsis deserti TaxID=2605988 RepID=UPI0012391D19|nr:hypothetical protein [Nocardiopsis deserti]
MKFDIVRLDQDEEALPPRKRPPARVPGQEGGPSAPHPHPHPHPHPGLRIQRSSEYMRLRAHTDLTRVRSALNQMLHTVEALRAEPEPVVRSGPDHGTGTFRPEAFRSRPAPEEPREQCQEESP